MIVVEIRLDLKMATSEMNKNHEDGEMLRESYENDSKHLLISEEMVIKDEGWQRDKSFEENNESKKVSVQKVHMCHICDKTFTGKSGLKKHILIHTGQKPFTCQVCAKSFRQNSHLTEHLIIHTAEKQHVCQECNTSFTLAKSLTRHLLTHDRQLPYGCEICGKRFTRRTNLNLHLKVHSGLKLHTCEVCDKSFTHKSSLKEHLMIHTGQKPHTCEICDKSFIQSSHLNRHLKTHSEQKAYACEICDKSYIEYASLARHLLKHSVPQNTCTICFVTFKRKSCLNAHVKTHTEEKCDDSKKVFTLENLERHTVSKPYTCETCNKNFIDRSGLNRHLKIHTCDKNDLNRHTEIIDAFDDDSKPHVCEICNKCFPEKGSLQKHLLRHAGEKPYVCAVCDSRFTDRSSWRRHSKTHLEPVTCAKCGDPCAQLNTHVCPSMMQIRDNFSNIEDVQANLEWQPEYDFIKIEDPSLIEDVVNITMQDADFNSFKYVEVMEVSTESVDIKDEFMLDF